MTKRVFDFSVSFLALLIFAVPMLVIGILVRATSKGPAMHWSKRVGIKNQIYLMPKFRTMRIDTPQVATHLLQQQGSDQFITPLGAILRKTSLDELPQIWSVLVGDMSLVGPRPALFNQEDLIALRTQYGVHELLPGVTGWAQINGRDDLPIPVKVEFDREYMEKQSFLFDLKILLKTFNKVILREGVHH